jgi:hypothetical protein
LAREVSAGCGNTKACRERADRARGISGEALERAVGARTAALLRAGVLALGGAEIDVRYSDEGELKPRVGIELAFPVVQVPEF